MTQEDVAKLRWQHVKDRAAKEGVAFDLPIDFFLAALRRGVAAEAIFPDHQPEDAERWRTRLRDATVH